MDMTIIRSSVVAEVIPSLITKEPMAALEGLIAVILVIMDAITLFMAGSIAFLKMLRNKKTIIIRRDILQPYLVIYK